MFSHDMSTRAIAPVVWANQSTVVREVDQWRTDDRGHTQALISQVKLRD